MKTLLFLLLLLPALCYAQAKKPVSQQAKAVPRQIPAMNGVGPFKIGLTSMKDIAQLCVSSGISLQSSYSANRTRPSADSTLAFVVPYESEDNYADASPLSSPCPNVTVVYFPKFTIASFEVQDVILRLYNNVLFEVTTSESSELAKAFKLKYGPPVVSTLSKTSTCLYRLTGNKVPLHDQTFFERWYNGNIVALSYLSKSYNSKCEEEFTQTFSVEDQVKAKLVTDKEEALLKVAAAKSQAAKRSKLSDL